MSQAEAALSMLPPDLDPALPGLGAALDPTQVVGHFEADFSGRCGGSPIATCVRQHIRWTPGLACVVTYRLAATGPEAPPSTIGAVEIDPVTVRYRLLAPDPLLPGLEAATDERKMTTWWGETLGRPIERCSIAPVAYRPGLRSVLRYRLSGPPDTIMYGKVLTAGGAGRLAATLAALRPSITLSVVGFAPEWQLIVTDDAGSRSLSSVVAGGPGPAAREALEAGGRLLAQLHSRIGPPGPPRALTDDADELAEYLPAVSRVSPACSARLAQAIDRLRAIAAPCGPSVASHGTFRLDQVLMGEAGPRLVDLDSYCWAEPARDLGNLLAYLRWRAIRGAATESTVVEVGTAFLDGYSSQKSAPLDEARVATYQAASLLKIAGRRYQALAIHEWSRVPDLIEAAFDLLAARAPGIR